MRIYKIAKDKPVNNAPLLLSKICKAATNYNINNLGKTESYPLLLLTPKIFKDAPNVLIAAGFHGDETAPVLALLKTLETNKWPQNINISFLPCVNPTGFLYNTRENIKDEDPNRGFDKDARDEDGDLLPKIERVISLEGKHMFKHIDVLKTISSTAFLTLHEDDTIDEFYLYTNTEKENGIENSLIEVGSEYFDIVKKSEDRWGRPINNGIAKNIKDGSLEDYLFKLGIDPSITTETPRKLDLQERITTNINLINTFVKYFAT